MDIHEHLNTTLNNAPSNVLLGRFWYFIDQAHDMEELKNCVDQCVRANSELVNSDDGERLISTKAQNLYNETISQAQEFADMPVGIKLKKDGINAVSWDNHMGSVLHLIASFGKNDPEKFPLSLVEKLISFGAHVNLKDRYGHTPIYNALLMRYPEMMSVLIKNGANLNTTDKVNRSPLEFLLEQYREIHKYSPYYANNAEYFYLVQILLNSGARIRQETIDIVRKTHMSAKIKNLIEEQYSQSSM